MKNWIEERWYNTIINSFVALRLLKEAKTICNRVTMTRYEEMSIFQKQFTATVINTFGLYHEDMILRNMNVFHEKK